MRVGVAQCEITPAAGAELSGFAARIQPSLGVLDPLHARALYLCGGTERLLWIQADLIGFAEEFVRAFHEWAQATLGLRPAEVVLSASHTHSGPATIRLEEAGQFDRGYAEKLGAALRDLARRALARTEPCQVVTATAALEFAVDRRHGKRTRAGLEIAGAGLRREDNTFAAVVACYPVHPVALGPRNRLVSGDIHGAAARALSAQLPGAPVVLMCNGACGDLNPPAENVPFAHVAAWGRVIADRIAPALLASTAQATDFAVASAAVALPLDVLSPAEIDAFADAALRDHAASAAWGAKFRRVVERWRRSQFAARARGPVADHRDVAVTAIRLGGLHFVTVGAEVFSSFHDLLRAATGLSVQAIGYTNGNVGYLAPRNAYTEGGYEVERAHLFYGGFRFRAGALERLAEHAARLLGGVSGKLNGPTAAVLAEDERR